MQIPSVITTKLTVPRTSKVLARQRLFGALNAIRRKRLALVVAGAGYGKTTLVAQWMRQAGMPAVWFALDRHDVDFTYFIQHLVQGVLNRFPDATDISQGNRWGMASACDLLCEVYLQSGRDPEAAEDCIRKGLEAIKGRELSVTEGILEAGLAGVMMEKGHLDAVPALLETA